MILLLIPSCAHEYLSFVLYIIIDLVITSSSSPQNFCTFREQYSSKCISVLENLELLLVLPSPFLTVSSVHGVQESHGRSTSQANSMPAWKQQKPFGGYVSS